MTPSLRLLTIAAVLAATSGCVRTTMYSPMAPTAAIDVTNVFSSEIIPGGSASREFTLITAGRIAITLTSTSPPGMAVGLGIGIPRLNGSCALSQAVEATAGTAAQIALAADIGPYCTRIYDLGTLTAPLSFSISISLP